MILVGFFIGFLAALGCVALLIVSEHARFKKELPGIKSDIKSAMGDIDAALKNAELVGSVKYRFKQIEEITNSQFELIRQADRPSASAAHSKHKNSIISELKKLEADKLVIFKSILADGIDPVITIFDEHGQKKNIKMSEVVAMHESVAAGNTPPPKTDSKSPRDNVVHLRLVKKENNDESKPRDP